MRYLKTRTNVHNRETTWRQAWTFCLAVALVVFAFIVLTWNL